MRASNWTSIALKAAHDGLKRRNCQGDLRMPLVATLLTVANLEVFCLVKLVKLQERGLHP